LVDQHHWRRGYFFIVLDLNLTKYIQIFFWYLSKFCRAHGVALKDVDFDQNRRKIVIGKEMKIALYNQIESDTIFLLNHNILDYSLLIGISFGHTSKEKQNANLMDKRSHVSIFQRDFGGTKGNIPRQNIHFFFGIIDILTQWDVSKMSEYGMKTIVLLQDATQISAIRPPLYHKRFMEYMDKIIT